MALQSSGAISLSDIQTELGGTNPISLSEYYRGGDYTTSNNTSVPTSDAISLSNFYGAVAEFAFTITSNQQEMNLSTYATALGWDGITPIAATIASGVYIWSDSTSTGALTIPSSLNGLVTITNNGYIIGKGGNGARHDASATAGGPALVNNATGVTLTNASGAFIAGGGGGGARAVFGIYSAIAGGGGGAGGGAGGTGIREDNGARNVVAGGAGGAVGQAGSNGAAGYSGGATGGAGYGGGSGGGGAGGENRTDGYAGGGGGGGGGRILAGTGGSAVTGNGINGGAGGNAGGAGSLINTGGGGGWGAAGGGGAAGGAAISGTAIATYTDNGTVYGSVA